MGAALWGHRSYPFLMFVALALIEKPSYDPLVYTRHLSGGTPVESTGSSRIEETIP